MGLVLGFGLLVLGGCVEPITLDEAFERRVVAEGVFLEGQHPALLLSSTVSRTQPDSFPPVEDALVHLDDGATTLPLFSVGGGFYATEEVRLEEGQDWQIRIEWEGETYEAEVHLPQRLAILDSLSHSVRVDSLGFKRSRLTLHYTVQQAHRVTGFWSLRRDEFLLAEGSLDAPLTPGTGSQTWELNTLLLRGMEVHFVLLRVDEGFWNYLQALGNQDGLPVIG
ncbi:MAG: DUF4249 family protein, partial [Bacteroidetes bacterium]